MAQQVGEEVAVRDFHIDVPEEELVYLRRRIAETRWPEKETVEDQSQGPRLTTMQALARYWAEEYDWRKVEAKLNSYPQIKRGNTLPLSGTFSGAKVAYLPTDRDLGVIVEIFSGTPGAEQEPDAT